MRIITQHTIRLRSGDVAKLVIEKHSGVTLLSIYEHREEEPLIIATLSDDERLALVAMLMHRAGPAPPKSGAPMSARLDGVLNAGVMDTNCLTL